MSRPAADPDVELLASRIDAVLPQTQCRQCGFDGCLPYARSIAAGSSGIDRCPPGGPDGVVKLAAVTGLSLVPLDPSCGTTKPFAIVAVDEAVCIGCTLCIQACPVDAIVGAAKRMHVVVADLCTGCELCVPPCPVDCIVPIAAPFAWDEAHAAAARIRHRTRDRRLARIAAEDPDRKPTAQDSAQVRALETPVSRRDAIVAAAVERARSLAAKRREAR